MFSSFFYSILKKKKLFGGPNRLARVANEWLSEIVIRACKIKIHIWNEF